MPSPSPLATRCRPAPEPRSYERETLTRDRRTSATPRLRHAASRCERRLGIEDFADRADAGLAELGAEALQKLHGSLWLVGMDAQPRVDERADQPAPHRALVIRGVARAEIAVVGGLVIGMGACKRPQPDGREQLLLDHVDDARPPALVEDRIVERNGEDLVGTKRLSLTSTTS